MSSENYKDFSSSSCSTSNPDNQIDNDSDDESPVSVQTNNSPENPPNQFHSNNPFRSSASAISESSHESTPVSQPPPPPPKRQPEPQHLRTKIPNQELLKYPFKTLNRILDDLKWTVPVKEMYNFSLLNSKPIDYSEELSRVVDSSILPFDTLILNNDVDYCKSVENWNFLTHNKYCIS